LLYDFLHGGELSICACLEANNPSLANPIQKIAIDTKHLENILGFGINAQTE